MPGEKGTSRDEFGQLLKRAEALIGQEGAKGISSALSSEASRKLLHELHTYQIELELQNEELRHAQTELEQSRRRYTALYDFAPVGYLTLSNKNLITEANLAVADMLGVARGNLLKRPFSAFILSEDQDIFYLSRRRLLETPEKQVCELRMRKIDGSVFHVQLESAVNPEVDGSGGQFRSVITDISTRKEAENILLDHSEALERMIQERTAELEEKTCQAETASRAKTEMCNNISHEFRTPLNAVIGFSDLMLATGSANLTDQQQKWLATIRASGWHLLAMVEGMLKVSQLDKNTAPLEIREIVLKDALQEVIEARRYLAAKPAIQCRLNIEAGLSSFRTDEDKIKEVVGILLSNAFKFTPEGGFIELRLKKFAAARARTHGFDGRQADNILEISVIDNGIGIGPQDQERLFRPFEQLDASSTKQHGGIGLGLFLASKLTALMDGKIGLESEGAGKGCRFYLLLPAGL